MAASTLKSSAPQVVDHQVSRLVFCVSFAVFLVIALVAELLTMRWRSWFPGAEGEGSLIGGVKSAVYTFMSSIP
jgi:light-harvesting complex 1 beta chain